MKQYVFKIWNDDSDEIKEVLVVADSEEEAVNKLNIIDFDYDRYEITGEEYYDFVIS